MKKIIKFIFVIVIFQAYFYSSAFSQARSVRPTPLSLRDIGSSIALAPKTSCFEDVVSTVGSFYPIIVQEEIFLSGIPVFNPSFFGTLQEVTFTITGDTLFPEQSTLVGQLGVTNLDLSNYHEVDVNASFFNRIVSSFGFTLPFTSETATSQIYSLENIAISANSTVTFPYIIDDSKVISTTNPTHLAAMSNPAFFPLKLNMIFGTDLTSTSASIEPHLSSTVPPNIRQKVEVCYTYIEG